MASSYTQNLGLQQPATGDQTNAWGTTVNTNWAIVDDAVAGQISINLPAQSGYPTVVLGFSQGTATAQLPNRRLVFTGALTANTMVLFPQGRNAEVAVQNNTSGAFSLTLGVNNNSGGALGATVAVSQGQAVDLYSDGTNIEPKVNATAGGLAVNGTLAVTTPLGIASGGTGAATLAGAGIVTGPGSAVAGNLPSFADTTGKVLQDSGVAAASLVPSGTVLPFAGAAAPSGYLLANGQSVSTTTYAALFTVIGYTYGGSGSNFNVPDLRGRAIAGYDPSNASGRLTGSTSQGVSAAALGNTGGEQAHTLIAAEAAILTYTSLVSDPGHNHTINQGAYNGNGGNFAAFSSTDPQVPNPNVINPSATGISVSTTSNAGGGAHNAVQPTIILNYIIKI